MMGNVREAQRRRGCVRLGPEGRESELEEKRARDRERQRLCRSRKRAHAEEERAEQQREIEGLPQCRVESSTSGGEPRVHDREIRRAVSRVIASMSEVVGVFPSQSAREKVLQKVWEHPFSTSILPLETREKNIAEQEILSGLAQSLKEVKQSKSKVELATKHAILTAVVSSGRSGSMRKKARLLGVHHRNVSAAILRRRKMDSAERFQWVLSTRKVRVDVLSTATKNAVVLWWISETRMSPNRKEVVRKRIGPGKYEEKPTQYLLETQMRFYLRFRQSNPTVIIGKRMFESLRPWYVKSLKERNVCCCIYHVEMDELRQGFNNMRQKSGMHNSRLCSCTCEEVCRPEGHDECACIEPCWNDGSVCCKGSLSTYAGTSELQEAILCPKGEFFEWHNKACIYGECQLCGVELLPICPNEEEGISNEIVQWKRFEMVEVVTTRGEKRRKLQLVYKNTTFDEFLAYFRPKLQFFVQHSFVAKWEDRQFRDCLNKFPDDALVSVVDFAENYSFQVQNEVQSMHWHSYQVSILVHISFRRNPRPDPNDDSSKTLVTYHFYISDDRKHDSYFVQHCLMLHWDSLEESGFRPKNHYIWSDGCASQFKSKIPWYFVSRYPDLTGGCNCVWSFFGSGHGKGPHDGAGAVLKRYIRQVQLDAHGPQLQCAEDVVTLLREKLSGRPASCYSELRRSVERKFWLIGIDDIDREHEFLCDTISGTHDLHSVRSVSAMDVNKLLVRRLACFCHACFDERWDQCANVDWCGDWKVEVLRIPDVAYVQSVIEDSFVFELWDDFGTDGENLASCLDLGENFATAAEEDNEEGVDFYLLVCCSKPYVVREAFTCPWGEQFLPGQLVVRARYFQKWGTGSHNYVYRAKSQYAHCHVGDIRVVKFPMIPQTHRVQGNDPVYALPEDVEACIRQALGGIR